MPAIAPVAHSVLRLRTWLLRLACHAQLATLHRRQDGISMAEYILMAAAVLIIALAAINGFFNAIARAFERLTQRLDNTG